MLPVQIDLIFLHFNLLFILLDHALIDVIIKLRYF